MTSASIAALRDRLAAVKVEVMQGTVAASPTPSRGRGQLLSPPRTQSDTNSLQLCSKSRLLDSGAALNPYPNVMASYGKRAVAPTTETAPTPTPPAAASLPTYNEVEINELRRRAQEGDAAKADALKAVMQMEALLSEHKTQIGSLDELVKQKERDLTELQVQYAAQLDEADSLRRGMAEKNEDFMKCLREHDVASALLREENENLKRALVTANEEHVAALAELRVQFKELNNDASAECARTAESELELTKLRKENESLTAKVEDLQTLLKQRDVDVEQLKKEVEAAKNEREDRKELRHSQEGSSHRDDTAVDRSVVELEQRVRELTTTVEENNRVMRSMLLDRLATRLPLETSTLIARSISAPPIPLTDPTPRGVLLSPPPRRL